MRNQSTAKSRRLFEVATPEEWVGAEFNGHLDVWQALHHLREEAQAGSAGEQPAQEHDAIVRICLSSPDQLQAKRRAIFEYSRRMKLSVQTRYRLGWIFIKNVTKQREQGKKRGRLGRQF